MVCGCLAVAGPAAPALQLAQELRARSCRRVHHLVACLQQAAAEVLLRQPEECAAAGWCAQAPGWPLHAARRRAGDHLGREIWREQCAFRRCAQRYRPASAGGLPGQQSRHTAFVWLMGMALINDGLLVCNLDAPTTLYKFAKDGSMDELATVPVLAGCDKGFMRCAVHQETQRTYAIGMDQEGNKALVVLDANLQVVATVPDVAGDDPIRDVAVHGDQVIVLAGSSHAKGSGLRLLDLDGRLLRTIAAGQFRHPQAVAASHGRAFVLHEAVDKDEDDEDDEDEVEPAMVLHVVDIQSGDSLQRLRIDLEDEQASAILVDGDEIFIASPLASGGAGKVFVLQYAGSDA